MPRQREGSLCPVLLYVIYKRTTVHNLPTYQLPTGRQGSENQLPNPPELPEYVQKGPPKVFFRVITPKYLYSRQPPCTYVHQMHSV